MTAFLIGCVLLTLGAVIIATLVIRRRRQRHAALEVVEILSQSKHARRATVRNATDLQLCELWRRSGREIKLARLAATLEWYADLRKEILDELTARDERGVATWLAEQPESDPRVYLRRHVR